MRHQDITSRIQDINSVEIADGLEQDERQEQENSANIFFAFDIGGTTFMVSHEVRCEYLQKPVVSRLPLMPEWLHGLVNVRGVLTPVFDVHAVLGNENSGLSSTGSHVLILDKNENAAGLLTDNPPRVVTHSMLDKEEHTAIEASALEGLVEAVYKKEGRDYFVIRHIKLFESLNRDAPFNRNMNG